MTLFNDTFIKYLLIFTQNVVAVTKVTKSLSKIFLVTLEQTQLGYNLGSFQGREPGQEVKQKLTKLVKPSLIMTKFSRYIICLNNSTCALKNCL